MKIFLQIIILGMLPCLCFGQPPFCYRNLESNFFKPNLVNEALSLHSVPQSNWSLINDELQKNAKEVPRLVQERAAHMNPNPFIPFDPQAASALLRSVLLEVFSNALALYYVPSQNKANEMFQYIRERQSQLLLSCFGEEEPVHARQIDNPG